LQKAHENLALCYKRVMMTDTHSAAAFYASARGAVTGRLLGERLVQLWPAETMRRQSVLGIGFAPPYLQVWQDAGARCVALSPAQIGAARWSAAGGNLSCQADEDALPFPDLCFDRVVLVHGLEAAENARRLLREVWRVLRDDGRLIVVAPNRRGMWAHTESTPFGQGEPYSPGQIGRLLAAAMFRIERRDTALFMPPSNWRLVLRSARIWEQAGRALAQGIAGVTISEAIKDLYAAVPAPALRQRRLVLARAA
jgi:SAM-dependent methyltransferase